MNSLYYNKLIFLLLIIIFIIIYYYFLKNKYENFNQDNNIFYTKDETYMIISSNIDNYYNRFTKLDLIARNSISIDDYIKKIKVSPVDFTDTEINIINNLINLINKIDISCNWINSEKFQMIPWKICLINDNNYENGLPHTRNDNIIIPRKHISFTSDFMNTLLHEKLHVYQKLYPEDFEIYLISNNFIKYKQYENVLNINYRSNPDTNEWIYTKDDIIYKSEYSSLNPKSLFDVNYEPINKPRYEHPRELSVYNLLEKINFKL